MPKTLTLLLFFFFWFVCRADAQSGGRFEWQTATPESQGMSTAKLDALKDSLAAKQTKTFLVVRNDRVVYEWYAADHSATTKHYTASMAKALVGGMSLAVAIHDGRMKLDDPVSQYVPQWRRDRQKAKITIRQLGSHTSGLEDSSVPGIAHPNEPGWKGEFWKRNDPPKDPFTISRDTATLLFEPGAKLQYSNPGIAMLTYAITAAIHDGPEKDVRTLLRERIMRPIGVNDIEWSIGYGQTYSVEGLPLVAAWGGGSYTARAVARIGRLVIREGDWDGTRLSSRNAVRQVTTDAGLPGSCGMGWWTNAGGRYAWLPRDAVWGAGAGDQVLLVVPSCSLIMVRNGASLGEDPDGTDDFGRSHDQRAKILFKPLIEAIVDKDRNATASPAQTGSAPYPPSPLITAIHWAPRETIVRQAKGCDNWPLTWADDGNLYAAYGDGNGFAPFLDQKLSLGLAKITGGPNDFQGSNLRSASAEQMGEGPQGKKASGLLMVEGVLYMWVRNAANSQLAWSEDHGNSWTWADWKWTTSFGSPTFLNFGQNSSGARDNFVYVYSSDSDTAYEPADRMVLARVTKDRIRDRKNYEFFMQLNSQGVPQWTTDVRARGAVFTHRGRCYRTGITYCAALKRYLWCQILPESTHPGGPRFQGGFGIYEAPEPWGPWHTAFFTQDWDVGPGETGSLPTKWMSADGRTMYLVFSGDDHFSVRRANLAISH